MRAADDFAAIRARMEAFQRERRPEQRAARDWKEDLDVDPKLVEEVKRMIGRGRGSTPHEADFTFGPSGFRHVDLNRLSASICMGTVTMSQPTYDAAWRLLEVIGEDRGPMLSRAAAELRACLMREQVREESRPPAENPYFQG